MKLAMLACLAALCLTGPIAHAAPGETTRAAPTANGTHPPETAAPHPAPAPAPSAAPTPGAAPAQAAPRTANSARAERRRRSYAACNRASHQRGLRGGKRRRFLIRCRLGYERTRVPGGQPAAAAPAQPGRKP